MKVGIITFHRAHNLGAILQAYALTTYIKREIDDSELIDFFPNNAIPQKDTLIHKVLRIGKHVILGKKYEHRLEKERKMRAFMKHYTLSDNSFYGDLDIKANPPKYDVLISGGDQILNQTLSGNSESYYLTFDNKARKISYSSSFGRTQISKEEKRLVSEELPKFERIACREASGAKIVESLTGKQAQVVVDPVFLLDDDQWNAVSSNNQCCSPYIFVYAMEDTEQLKKAVSVAKQTYNLPTVVVQGKGMACNFGGVVDESCGPAEFISYIRDAAVVVTNSFHGIAFSILYKKEFFAVAHSERNARIEDLLSMIQADSKLIGWENEPDEIKSIDGKKVYDYMLPNIELSKKYLHSAIEGDKWEYQSVQSIKNQTIGNIVKTKKCSYCRACIQICPREAITVIEDKTGNRYPKIKTDKCVSCGLCAKVCPNINPCKSYLPDYGYAVRINDHDALLQSTSGGVFTALSDVFLNSGGVVIGAAFDTNWQCRHIIASTKNERDKLRGAKYLQSDVDRVYTPIVEYLKNGKKVLFSGTPCQVAGIKNYLELKKVSQENLLLVDIVCHGVAAQTYFDRHIEYLQGKYGEIVDYRFRSKEVGWHGYNVRVQFKNGKVLLNDTDANGYAELYFRSLLMRESCLRCQYSSISRVGDITIGDFWGIDKITDVYDDNMGVSSVFANNDKGERYINDICGKVQMEKFTVDQCMQPNLQHAAIASPETILFLRDMERYGFKYCVNHYTDSHPMGWIGRKYRRVNRKIRKLID